MLFKQFFETLILTVIPLSFARSTITSIGKPCDAKRLKAWLSEISFFPSDTLSNSLIPTLSVF